MAWKQLVVFISLAHFFIVPSCATHFHYCSCPETVLTTDDDTKIYGFQGHTGDIILGGLFAVHSFDPGSDGGEYTDVIWYQVIETLEAMLYTIDTVILIYSLI